MRRVSVVGNSGSGKSTVAAALARQLGVPYVELDAIFHQPGWTELPVEEFRARVAAAMEAPGWVVDGNYSVGREQIWALADTVVWVDPPRWRVMSQVMRRTLARTVLRRELWNGNREPLSNLWSWDPQKSIIAWAWTRHAVYRERFSTAMVDPEWSRIRFVRLRSRAETRRFLAGPHAARGHSTDHDSSSDATG